MHWFFSYSHNKSYEVFIKKINKYLTNNGIKIPGARNDAEITIYQDKLLDTGQYWRIELIDQLEDCDGGVIVLTPDLETSEDPADTEKMVIIRSWLFYEATRLMQRHMDGNKTRLLTILLGTTIEKHALTRFNVLHIGDIQYVSIDLEKKNDFSRKLAACCKYIKKISSENCYPNNSRDNVHRMAIDVIAKVYEKYEGLINQSISDLLIIPQDGETQESALKRFKKSREKEAVCRALASFLLAGPPAYSQESVTMRRLYFTCIENVCDRYLHLLHSQNDQNFRRQNLEEHFGNFWISCDRAYSFVANWVDTTKQKRVFVFKYSLDNECLESQKCIEILLDFFNVAQRMSILQHCKNDNLDNRTVHDMYFLFERLRVNQKFDYVFEVDPYDGVDTVYKDLTKHYNEKVPKLCKDNRLPVVLDFNGILLDNDLRQLNSDNLGCSNINLQRIVGQKKPPCIFIFVNETDYRDRVINAANLLESQNPMLNGAIINIDLDSYWEFQRCLEYIPSHSTQNN